MKTSLGEWGNLIGKLGSNVYFCQMPNGQVHQYDRRTDHVIVSFVAIADIVDVFVQRCRLKKFQRISLLVICVMKPATYSCLSVAILLQVNDVTYRCGDD